MVRAFQLGWVLLCTLVSATQSASPRGLQQEATIPHSHPRSEEAKSLLSKGLQYLDQARYGQAIADFRQALEIDPDLTTAQYDLGVAYFSDGQFEEARRSFQEVLRYNPNHAFSLYFLARLDLTEGDVEKAIRGLRLLL